MSYQHVLALKVKPFVLVLSLSAAFILSFTSVRADSVFVVTKTAYTTDGVCDSDCSLYEAIAAANANPDLSIINFDIPGSGVQTIQVNLGLTISYPITIDGTTQIGYSGTPLIELDGMNRLMYAFINFYPFQQGDGSTIRGLAIINFGAGGISFTGMSNAVIEDNFIGVAADGVTAGGNGSGQTLDLQGNAIECYHCDHNIIRGNVIADSRQAGLLLGNESDSNVVEHNLIGTNAAGSAALGTQRYGIFIGGSYGNVVGGTTVAARNVISGNQVGILLTGAVPGLLSNNVVEGNFIGSDLTGTQAIGNSEAGIQVSGFFENQYYAVSNDIIGGTSAGAGNLIAYNGIGIEIQDVARGTAVEGNAIYANTGLGIDIGADGVTPNDAKDVDDGPNTVQNFPELNSPQIVGNSLVISGHLNSTPGRTFRIELFLNHDCDASGNGEGEIYLGAVSVVSSGTGNATFSKTVVWNGTMSGIVTATATDSQHNTSEFSSCMNAVLPAIPPPPRNYFTMDTAIVTWTPVSGATGYEVQVDTDSAFKPSFTLDDNTIPADTHYAQISGLTEGTYYWHVRAKKADGTWGDWSVFETFVVDL